MEKYRFGLDAELAEGEDPLSFIRIFGSNTPQLAAE